MSKQPASNADEAAAWAVLARWREGVEAPLRARAAELERERDEARRDNRDMLSARINFGWDLSLIAEAAGLTLVKGAEPDAIAVQVGDLLARATKAEARVAELEAALEKEAHT